MEEMSDSESRAHPGLTVAHLVQRPQRRGAELFARHLSQSLEQRGHRSVEIHLYRPPASGALPLRPGDHCLEGEPRHLCERVAGFHPGLLRRLSNLLTALSPDLVQANGGRTVKYGALARGHTPAPWPLLYRNIGDPTAWGSGLLHRFVYRRFVMPRLDGVVAVSTSTLRALNQLYRLEAPAVVVRPGIPPDLSRPTEARRETRRRWRTPESAPLVIAVGSLTPEKRPDRLLRVVDRVRRSVPNVHVWWVGAGPLSGALEEEARRLGLQDRFHLLGAQEWVATPLAAADVLVLTSDTEGLPAVILEAGALGLPVVAPRVGGIAEAVVDGTTGLLTPAGDEAGLARAVEDLLREPSRARALGESARRHVEERFSWDRTVDGYLEHYHRVIDGHRSQRKRREEP